MRSNILKVSIQQPLSVVFDYTIDPKNTPKWIETITEEMVSELPITIGTIYRNKSISGDWNQYSIFALKMNALFELIADDDNYHVRYSYVALSDKETEMEYFEWVDEGELEAPFMQKTLDTLKHVLES